MALCLTCLLYATQVKMQEIQRDYKCANPRCQHTFHVFSDPEQGNILEMPVHNCIAIAILSLSSVCVCGDRNH